MNVNDNATNIIGTVAKPSNPSVRFTAFEEPIITNKPKGIKIFQDQIKFLKEKNINYLYIGGLKNKL